MSTVTDKSPKPDPYDSVVFQESCLPLTRLAAKVRSGLTNRDDKYMRSLVAYINSRPDWNSVATAFSDVMITSVRHLNAYNLDFGGALGQIESFALPVMPDGQCVIAPPRSTEAHAGNPPWEVRITLEKATMELLEKDNLLNWTLE
jgi:hypothetical protein